MPARAKMVYVSPDAHRQLRLLAARRNRPMGEVVATLVEQELADLTNPWTGPEGLALQERLLAKAWEDPALDVYNEDALNPHHRNLALGPSRCSTPSSTASAASG